MAEIRIRDQGKITVQDADSSNEVSLQAPSTVASNQTFVLPNTDGNNNDVIKTDGAGNLSFVDIDTVHLPGISWQTGDVKTSDFIVGAGSGIFVDTSSGAVTATLPASPSAGDFIAFKDYAGTFATNNFTVNRNGNNIQGSANNSIIKTNRASVVLQYIDSTKGWLYIVENNVGDLEKKLYVTATGGTITTSGNFKIHTFTGDGTFTVTDAGNSAGSNTVSYMVIAGGGGGAKGGGGAGGYRESESSFDSYTQSPVASSGGLSVSAQAYPVTVGAGGAGAPDGAQSSSSGGGAASVFSTVTSTGGGGGAGDNGGGGGAPGGASGPGAGKGGAGGSGGGGSNGPLATGGATIAVPGPSGGGETVQGFAGQGNFPAHSNFAGGGGGGASEVGGSNGAAQGGDGATTSINASPVTRGGGGGAGGSSPGPSPSGAAGGSGGGGSGGNHPNGAGTAGTSNTGGGGGGGSQAPGGNDGDGANGGSGVVIIRYKYQN